MWIYVPSSQEEIKLRIRPDEDEKYLTVEDAKIYFYRKYENNKQLKISEEINSTVQKVRELCKEKAYVFGVITDTHVDYKAYNHFQNTLYTIDKVNAQCQFDAILHLGDVTDGWDTPEATLSKGAEVISELRKINSNVYVALGNHETNFNYSSDHFETVSMAENYAVYGRYNEHDVVRTGNDMYYYKDFGNLRIIVLNSVLTGIVSNDECREWAYDMKKYGYGQKQLEWLETVLSESNDKHILLLSHMPLTKSYLSEYYTPENRERLENFNGDDLREVIETFKNNGGNVIGLIHGHYHADYNGMYSANGIWEVGLTSCLMQYNKSDKTWIANLPGSLQAKRLWNDGTTESWNVCVINPESRKVTLVRFGAGRDFTFTY